MRDERYPSKLVSWLPGLALLLIACGIGGCSGPSEPTADNAEPADKRVFHRGNGGEPDTLDPHRSEETSGAYILRDLFEGLTTETVNSEVVPGVAKSWEISDGGLRYVFHLRAEARWSNGDPVTAEDFAFALRRTISPATASTYAQVLYPIVNARAINRGESPPESLGVRALDERTLAILLESPTPYFLQLLTHSSTYPVHRPSIEEYGDGFAAPGRLVSNGAYRLVEWAVQSHVLIERNEHYWNDGNTQIDVVYYHSTEDVDAELKRYRAGELDFTFQIPNQQYDWIQENLPGELQTAPYLSTYFYGFDMVNPPFDDPKLRQALSMAIDRARITENVTGVGEVPATGLVPPGVSNYTPATFSWADLSAEERIAEARRLYAEAGYSAENPLEVEILYNTSENHKKVAVAVASMWKQALGVNAKLSNQEWKVLLQTRKDRDAWEVLRYGWVGDYNDANTFLDIFRSGHGQNFPGFSDPRYDELTAAASQEPNLAKRAELMQQAEQVFLDAHAVVPIYFYVSKHLVKPHVKGYKPNIMDRSYSRHLRIDRDGA